MSNFTWEAEISLFIERKKRTLKFQTKEVNEEWKEKVQIHKRILIESMIFANIEAGRQSFIWYFTNEEEREKFITCSVPAFTVSLAGMTVEEPLQNFSVYWILGASSLEKPIQLLFPDENTALGWLKQTESIFTTRFDDEKMEFQCNGGIELDLWLQFATESKFTKVIEEDRISCFVFPSVKEKHDYFRNIHN